MYSNAEDAAKWLQFHLSGGKSASGTQLVSSRLLQDTYTPVSRPRDERDQTKPTYPVSDAMLSYDLAWMTNIYRGIDVQSLL